MRAFVLPDEGSPATFQDIAVPDPGPGEIRVAVKASSVNGFDVFVASGMARGMMEHHYPVVVGKDYAGVVDAAGEGVDRFAVGDEVAGIVPPEPHLGRGAYAEFVVVPAEGYVEPKPATLSFEQAASVGLAALTALVAVEAAGASDGSVVLVAGATGGVGVYAVQIAAAQGATVIATGRSEDEAWVRSLGADEVVDYTTDVVAQVRSAHPDGIDALIDAVNRGDAHGTLADLVREGGHVVSTTGAADTDGLKVRESAGPTCTPKRIPPSSPALSGWPRMAGCRCRSDRRFASMSSRGPLGWLDRVRRGASSPSASRNPAFHQLFTGRIGTRGRRRDPRRPPEPGQRPRPRGHGSVRHPRVERPRGHEAPGASPDGQGRGTDHRLALALWRSGVHEARLLAAMVDDPARVTERQMESWARDFDTWDIVDGTCASLFDRTPFAGQGVRLERTRRGVRQTGGVRADGHARGPRQGRPGRRVHPVPCRHRAGGGRSAERRAEGRELGAPTDRQAQRRVERRGHRRRRADPRGWPALRPVGGIGRAAGASKRRRAGPSQDARGRRPGWPSFRSSSAPARGRSGASPGRMPGRSSSRTDRTGSGSSG